MKKILGLALAAILFSCHSGILAGDARAGKTPLHVIQLNSPDYAKARCVLQALKNRKSTRDLSERKLTTQQLSELLWAANGVNRKDGKRTAPAALGIQAVDIYAVMPEGIYLYDALKSRLAPVVEGDFRKQCGMQDFVAIAPVNLVYVVDLAKFKKTSGFGANISDGTRLDWAYIAAGCQSQNVNLYCASEGLGAVVRGSIDKEKFGKILKLRPEQAILSAQTVGYPKQ